MLVAALHERRPVELEVLSLYGNLVDKNDSNLSSAVSSLVSQEPSVKLRDTMMCFSKLSFMVNHVPLVALYLTGDEASPFREFLVPLIVSVTYNTTLKVDTHQRHCFSKALEITEEQRTCYQTYCSTSTSSSDATSSSIAYDWCIR